MTMHRKSMEELDLLKSNSAATSANLESESSGQSNESTVKNVLSALIEENLSKLFECLQVEYGKHILVSPKWKNFGSQKLAFSEKTRLNNAIWRCWHLQFKKGKKPLFCQFVSPLSEEREPPKNTHLAVILEGRYWRRKLDAVAREYKRWRVYYKKKTQEAEEADRQRLRSLSISSGDETVSNQSPAMAQMMHIMDTHISTDVMLSSHPDTLFTSKSKHQLKEERQTPRDVMYQPTLDSLQPNLDEFVEHISSLADLIQQDETFTSSPRMASQRFSAEDINYQQQSHLEVMEHSTDYPTSCRQEYMDTSGSYNDYSVEYQDMEQPESLPEEPLPQLVEENSQEMYSPQPQESFEQLTSPVQSPLGSSLHGVPPNSVPQSPVQRSPSAMSPPSLGTSQYKASSVTTQHRQSFTTGSSMLSQQTDNVKITRNVSDSQLYNMESYGSPLKGVSLLPQYEPELPAQVQFPNLVAQLQSIQSKRPEVQASSSKVAKRARLPRNMSDSRLSSMGRVSRSSSLHNQSAVGTANMTPLEQIRAQAIAQGTMPPGPTYQVMPRFQTPVGHTKVPSYKRKSKMPRNMSDSSLLYMGLPQQHPQPSSSWIGQRVRKMSEPSLEVASSMAQQAFSQQLVAESLTPTSTQLVHSLASGVRESHSTLIDQLSQMSQASAQVPTSAGITSVPGVAGAGSLLGQLLLQNGNQSEAAAMTTTVDDNSQVMKQLLQLIQRQQHQQQQQQQQQQQSSQAMHSGELLALLKAVAQGDSCSDVASLLQASLQQGNQSQRQQLSLHNQQMQQQQIQQQQQLQQLLQHQQLQKQAPYAQQSSQLGTIQQTAQLQQQSTQSHQKQTQPQQLSPLQPFAPPTSQPLTQLLQQGAQSLPQLVAQISTMPVVQMSNLGIQTVAPVVRTTPIAIAPHPGTAVMAAPIHASSVLSTQYSLPIMTSATQGSKFAVTPLQQILRSTSPSLAAMTSQPSAAPGHQQFQVSNNEQSFTSSFSDPPGEHELSFVSSNVSTFSASTTAQPTTVFRQPLTTPSASKTQRTKVSDREQYKEHRRMSHISAEQKRRCNIKMGFDQLASMVPTLASQKSSKVSKATVLQKTVDYTTRLQQERQSMADEEARLKKEIQELNTSINTCQSQLPATGAPVSRQRVDQMLTLFSNHVKDRTQENFKFWIFSVLLRQLFESYNSSVSTTNPEEFCRTVLAWLDQHCTLPSLRPAVLAALRDISRTTSILTDPSLVPGEARQAASGSDPTNLSDSGASAGRGAVAENFFGGGAG